MVAGIVPTRFKKKYGNLKREELRLGTAIETLPGGEVKMPFEAWLLIREKKFCRNKIC